MNFEIDYTNAFKKDLRRAKAQHKDIDKLLLVVECLSEGFPLPDKHRDHLLFGDYHGARECHIAPDWLLIYWVNFDKQIIVLDRLGMHSELC